MFTLTSTSASASAAGGSASVNVSATAGCAWTATSNARFLSIPSGSGGNGSGSVTYNVTANGANFRSGTLTIGGQTFTIYQFGTGPIVSIDRPSLRYGATNSGGRDRADLRADATADADERSGRVLDRHVQSAVAGRQPGLGQRRA